jgi:hypothetical protein
MLFVILGTYTLLLSSLILKEPFEKLLNYVNSCKCGKCVKRNRLIEMPKEELIKNE